MRQIKFRAWDKQYQIMSDITMLLFSTNELDHLENGGEPKSMEHFEVMQFTGLKDRHGKDIYEGDLLAYPPQSDWGKENYAAFEVFFNDGDIAGSHIGFVMNRAHYKGSVCGGYIPSFKPSVVENMEIIGNIFEQKPVPATG